MKGDELLHLIRSLSLHPMFQCLRFRSAAERRYVALVDSTSNLAEHPFKKVPQRFPERRGVPLVFSSRKLR
jgi:hypothetical protein